MWDPALEQRQGIFLYLTRQSLTRISTPERSDSLRLGGGKGEVPVPDGLEERLPLPLHPVASRTGALGSPLETRLDLHVQEVRPIRAKSPSR